MDWFVIETFQKCCRFFPSTKFIYPYWIEKHNIQYLVERVPLGQNLVDQQNRKHSQVKYTQNIYNQDSKPMNPRIIEKI